MSQLLSSVIISAVGLTCKAFLNSGLCSITINNLPTLLNALRSEDRHSGRGVVTVSNHLSTLDDPVTWGILPFKNFTSSHNIRWVLGASDIMFTNPLFSAFFRKGQVIETFRGEGIWQPALDTAIEKLNQGHWLHMFGEGKVHQPSVYSQTNGITRLPRFKWGVGRIVMETDILPLIIPMWLTGFDKLMPEHRPFPYKYLPKMGIQLGVTFGEPISPDKIMDAVGVLRGLKHTSVPHVVEASARRGGSRVSSALPSRGWIRGAIVQPNGEHVIEVDGADARMDEVRSKVTAVIQRAVEELGSKASGDNLGHCLPRQNVQS